MNKKVVLIIIFNHNYTGNLDTLENMYRNRFENIFYLIPFYTGTKENVIPVYGSSHNFQGFVAQSTNSIFKEEYHHYLYIADDLILNPLINENNYDSFFMLNKQDSFIPEFFPLNNIKTEKILALGSIRQATSNIGNDGVFFWAHTQKAINYCLRKDGLEITDHLPSYEIAIQQFNNHNIDIHPLSHADIAGVEPELWEQHARYCLDYPLVAGYSDIFIISAETIKDFSHICGAFFATDLFVELAIPTALILTSNNIVTETNLNNKGQVYWPFRHEDRKKYETDVLKHQFNLKDFLQEFPAGKLYMHPVKLSKWSMPDSD
jgi:hypothetical protein